LRIVGLREWENVSTHVEPHAAVALSRQVSRDREKRLHKEGLRMRITQVFASASDERVISELDISPDQAISMPVTGDEVRWVVNDKVYTGRVKSRLIYYSPPTNIGLDSANEVNMRAVLRVQLDN
jgi:hypothetical protein